MIIATKTTKETSWEELKQAAKTGTLGWMLQSGDQIPMTLKNGEEVIFDVAHDKAGKTYFVLHNCLHDQHSMNDTWTNKGGWAACEMRKYLNTVVFGLLPDEVQEAIEPTTIVQVIDGQRVECADKLFLLSHTQVFGEGSYTKAEPEDTQLDIFLTERDRVKECADNGTWFWWERSPYYGNSNSFCLVSNSGTASGNDAGNTIGVAPGFCI